MTQHNHTFVHSPDGLKMIQRQTIVPKGTGNAYRPQQQPASRHRVRQTQAPQQGYDDLTPEEDAYAEDVYPPRMPTSTRRYNVDAYGRPQPAAGRRRIEQHYHTEPYDSQPEQQPTYRKRFSTGWILKAGIVLSLILIVLALFSMATNAIGTWWQNHQDNAAYGMPRTYQTDAVVGHNDSNSTPSHFVALNLRGTIYILEAPGGDFTKAKSYYITTEAEGNPDPPVTVAFRDINHDGRLDMVVTIGDPPNALLVFLFNNGSQFVSKL